MKRVKASRRASDPAEQTQLWQDDAEVEQLQNTRRKKYSALQSNEFIKWAFSKTTQVEEEEDKGRANASNPNRIAIKLHAVADNQNNHGSMVQCLDVASQGGLCLTAGFDKMVKLWSVQGQFDRHERREVELKWSMLLQKEQIRKAFFMSRDREVVACGSHKFIHSVDIEKSRHCKVTLHSSSAYFEYPIRAVFKSKCERRIAVPNHQGVVVLLDGESKQVTGKVEFPEQVTDVQMQGDSIWSTGIKGHIFGADLRMNRLLLSQEDEGSLSSTCLEVGGGMMATGCESGIVNLYRHKESELQLKKTVQNLVTSVTGVALSPNKELLLSFSKWKSNGVRLLSTKGLFTFANWPNTQTRLKYVSAGKFSRDGKLLWLGNDAGQLFCYSLGGS